MLIFIIIFIT